MQVKIFESTDMASGLKKVRQELGPDALILSTRTIKSGKLGLLGKQVLEITAAIDSPWPSKKKVENKVSLSATTAHKAYRQESAKSFKRNSEKVEDLTKDLTASSQKRPGNIQDVEGLVHSGGNDEIRKEFDDLKNMVANLAGQISQIHSNDSNLQEIHSKRVTNQLEQKLNYTRNNNFIENILLSQGVNNHTANTISSFAHDRLSDTELNDNIKLYKFLHETIADIITVKPPDFIKKGDQRRIALLGPTGVGKTTTLAKIAASYLSNISNSIALITIDTYRIAAVEQLKVYGEIMHLPVDVVITPQQLEKALTKHDDKGLILIDTAGRSPRDPLCIEELHTFLHPDLEIENHLVMSTTTRENELLQTIKQFNQISIDSLIFTKVDECANLGILLNILVQNNTPVSYITNGQRVPEDILEAEKQHIAKLVIPPPNGILND